jgi:acetyl-CoA carboxylase biotin carboxyl carrier protein
VLDEERDEARKRETLPFGEVERLVELLKGSGVGEIRVRSGDLEISVKARAEAAPPAPAVMPPVVAGEPVAEPEVAETFGEDGSHVVRSPPVGTFYRAPAPGEGPYVEVGDVVVEGQTLCIVEAMKMMNEIPSDVSGEVVEVVAENAKGVEYDQPLFRIRPVA